MDTRLLFEQLGAAVVLIAGFWIGLGMRGLKRGEVRHGDVGRRATLDRIWMNRMMRNRLAIPRRFSLERLIKPEDDTKAADGNDD